MQNSKEGGMASLYKCTECGFIMHKPSLLSQHMLAHSSERSFTCPIEGCTSTFKRRDHLNRHLCKHDGTTLRCTWPNCKLQCTNKSNFKRHLRRHKEKGLLQRCRKTSMDVVKMYSCPKDECGKQFRYLSAQQYHLDTAHGVHYENIVCSEAGCYANFSDVDSLLEHARLSHKYSLCEVCGKSYLKKNRKRHLRNHSMAIKETLSCPYANCEHTYTRNSNLRTHIKAVHLQVKPYQCSFRGCGKCFAFKSVRNNHEKTRVHLPRLGDFGLDEERLLLKPKGGRKKMTFSTVDDLFLERRCHSTDSRSMPHEPQSS